MCVSHSPDPEVEVARVQMEGPRGHYTHLHLGVSTPQKSNPAPNEIKGKTRTELIESWIKAWVLRDTAFPTSYMFCTYLGKLYTSVITPQALSENSFFQYKYLPQQGTCTLGLPQSPFTSLGFGSAPLTSATFHTPSNSFCGLCLPHHWRRSPW